MRIAASRLADRECRPGQQLDDARARRRAGRCRVQQQDFADLLLDRWCRRISEVIGSWMMMVMSLPRTCASALGMPSNPALEGIVPTDGSPPDRAAASSPTARSDCRSRIADQRTVPPLGRTRCDRREHCAALRKATERSDGESGWFAIIRNVFLRVEGVAHRFADEDQQRQHERDVKKPTAEPGRLDVGLALPSIPSDGEPGGRPKPRKSSAVSVITERRHDERQERHGRHHRVRQQVAEHDGAVRDAEARAAWMYSKLRPRRNSARTSPTSDTQENSSRIPSSTKKPGTSTGRDDQQQIERRDRGPDLDEALEQQVGPAAEIALHGAAATPMIDEMMVSVSPNSTEMRKP
jgi:hypothetical protein